MYSKPGNALWCNFFDFWFLGIWFFWLCIFRTSRYKMLILFFNDRSILLCFLQYYSLNEIDVFGLCYFDFDFQTSNFETFEIDLFFNVLYTQRVSHILEKTLQSYSKAKFAREDLPFPDFKFFWIHLRKFWLWFSSLMVFDTMAHSILRKQQAKYRAWRIVSMAHI